MFFFNRFILEIADFVFCYDFKYRSQYGTKKFFSSDQVFPYCVIYSDIICYWQFQKFIDIDVPFVLITGENDNIIPYNDYKNQSDIGFRLLENKNLIKWFGTNVGLNHPKLVSIPIGITKSIPFIEKNNEGLEHMSWLVHYIETPIESLLKTFLPKNNITDKSKKLLYVNFTKNNSDEGFCLHKFSNIRLNAIKILTEKKLYTEETKLMPWEQYIQELAKYKFCLSLPGRGLDCYRTWESLAVGVIPIVIRSCEDLYNDLPIVIIDDINELNEEFLNNQFENIVKNINNFNWSKLEQSYWCEKVRESIKSFTK